MEIIYKHMERYCVFDMLELFCTVIKYKLSIEEVNVMGTDLILKKECIEGNIIKVNMGRLNQFSSDKYDIEKLDDVGVSRMIELWNTDELEFKNKLLSTIIKMLVNTNDIGDLVDDIHELIMSYSSEIFKLGEIHIISQLVNEVGFEIELDH